MADCSGAHAAPENVGSDLAGGYASRRPTIQIIDTSELRFRVGTHVVLRDGAGRDTGMLFRTVLLASMALDGQPVRSAGFLPGVTLRATSGSVQPQDGEDADFVLDEVWRHVRPRLTEWLTAASSQPGMTMSISPGIQLELGWDDRYRIHEGVMEIDVGHDAAAVAAYAKRRRQAPLIVQPMSGADQWQESRFEIRRRLIDALVRSGEAVSDSSLARLPGPVRYRVTGAFAAWDAVREAADRVAAPTMTSMLQSRSLLSLNRYFEGFTRDLLPNGADGRAAGTLCAVAQYSAPWLAFEVRCGVFYEPTPPLHRLLDASYIADDVPVGMIRLPTDTLCIIPEPARWKRAGDVEAIAIFRHENSIGFVAWLANGDSVPGAAMDSITLPVDDPDRTIRELVDGLFRKSPPDSGPVVNEGREFWRNALDYAIKMLLYLDARDAQVVHDRAYSTAPRDFPGLGKRKRSERLAQIEQLYDRHIVGPAILDAEHSGATPPGDDVHHEVRGHWRRPHFRMQPHGPQASLRKLIFVGPSIVRADRLGI